MSIRIQFLRLLCVCFLLAPALSAQTSSTVTSVATGTALATENSKAVTGVRIELRPDGTVWFLIPSNDRIVQLQSDGVTFKQWQIRDDKNLGANPVDFEVDGDAIWFIENGESLIDAGRSVFARLDTVTGQLREWIVPGSRPAGFYRAPDGKVWLPQTNGRLQSIDLTTLDAMDYRSTKTFAYSDVVPGSDGALWMTDFGNNRIVRYVPGAATETSWTYFDPNSGRTNPSQIQFDDGGNLWISHLALGRMDRFNPATGETTFFGGFVGPIHFDFFGGRVYIAEATSANGSVVVLDPALAGGLTYTTTPETLTVGSVANKIKVVIRDTTITPVVFTSKADPIAGADLKVTAVSSGVVATEFPSTNGYGISAAGGIVWVGTEGKIARILPQTIGAETDLTVPVTAELGASGAGPVHTEITLFNKGSDPISGNILYLYSPGAFAFNKSFTIAPGETQFVPDAFAGLTASTILLFGPVRIQVTSGAAGDLSATVRAARQRDDGSSFGFAQPAVAASAALGPGDSRTLFTGARDADDSVFGFFSPSGAEATATLVAPGGSARGTRKFSLAPNAAQEFNPASSAFGVTPEPGDIIRVSVTSGRLQPYVTVLDTGSADAAISLPLAATRDAVLPNLGAVTGMDDTSFVSDLFLSNSDLASSANVTVSFLALGTTDPPATAPLTLPPGGSLAIADVLPKLFSVSAGQGTVLVSSDTPVFVSSRVAGRRPEGDYATFVPAFDGGEAIAGGAAASGFGVPQTATRRTHLLLYNRGSAGTVTVIGYDNTGMELGRISVDMAAGQAVRVNSVMEQFGVTDSRANRIRLETTPGLSLFAQLAEVDAATGDVEFQKLK